MTRGQQFYDPMIDQGQKLQMRGFQVAIGGTYVLLDDVVTALRAYAQSQEDPDAGALVHEVATWLQAGDTALPVLDTPNDIQIFSETFEQPQPQETPGADRVEIYPDDPTAARPKWMARACSAEGDILYVTNGSFDQDYVIRDAEQRWPSLTLHLIAHAGVDTVWEERDPGGIRSASSGDRRPSPKRLWA